MRKIVVVDYHPEWAEAFEREAARIAEVLGENMVAIHHIGSTSVPGLCAKPMGEFGIPGRRYFHKGGDERTHHVHVFAEENAEAIERHLAVSAYLRAHADEARAYGELKRALAARFPRDWDGYCDGKDEYVRALEARALKWYRTRKG